MRPLTVRFGPSNFDIDSKVTAMATEAALKPKRAKTETVTLRLDPKTKFMLDFMTRVQGRTITAIVEHAVRDAASNSGIEGDFNTTKTWASFWDANEGVRTLKLIADPNYPTNFEEDELLAFAQAHWEFFYTSANTETPRRAYLEVLWPRVEEFLSIWQAQRQEDYWAAGKAMAAALSSAKLQGPVWPRGNTKKEVDLNDDIPF